MPPEGWQPDATWPPAPPGWNFWLPEQAGPQAGSSVRGRAQSRLDQARSAAHRFSRHGQGDLPIDTLWSAEERKVSGLPGGRYRLDDRFLYVSSGTLSTRAQQVPIAYVVDVDLQQSVTQKARGVGDVVVHVVQPDGHRETVILSSIQNPQAAVPIINDIAARARAGVLRATNTAYHVTTVASEPQPAPQRLPAGPPPEQPDPIAQLERLGKLRDAGVISEEEFQAKKADLLDRL
jgi:hypothetical protein